MSQLATLFPGCTAAADYSTTGQYLCGYFSASRVVTTRVTDGLPVAGIIQNAPASGEAVELAVAGVCKAMYGGTVTAGDLLMAEVTTGRLVTATAALYAVAYAAEAGVDGDVRDVILIHSRVAA